MKKILILIALISFAINGYSHERHGINFIYHDYQKALTKAKEVNKPLMVFIYLFIIK